MRSDHHPASGLPAVVRASLRGTRGLAAIAVLVLFLGACADSSDEPAPATSTAPPTAEIGDPTWAHFGGSADNTRHAAGEGLVGPGNVADLEVAWELDGIDGETATPLYLDGILYFGDWSGTGHAVDAENGDVLWSTQITNPGAYIPRGAAIDDDRVYFGGSDAFLYALDRETGEVVWERRLHEHAAATIFGSPVRVDDLVIVGIASFEIALPLDDFTFQGAVVAVDAETGEERWRVLTTTNDESAGAGVSVWSSPAVDTERGVLYVGTGNTLEEPAAPLADGILALDVTTGELMWSRQFTSGDVYNSNAIGGAEGPDSDVGAAPNLFAIDGRDVVGVGDKEGTYYVLDRGTGEEVWSTKMTRGSRLGGQQASAAYAEGVIYVASNIGREDAIRVGDLADLIALDATTGGELWRTSLGSITFAPVTYANGVVYVANGLGVVAGYDAADGALLWSYELAATSAGGVLVADGRVYVGYGFWVYEVPENKVGGLIAFAVGSETGGPDEPGNGGDPGGGDMGRAVYQASCAGCHGPTGGGAIGPALTGVEDRLTVDEHRAIVVGGQGTMPAFGDALSPEQIDALVSYERERLGR